MTSDRATLDVVDLILPLAETLNLSVVAEGVENSTQFDLLRALGCPLGQGYLFSKPVEREPAKELLVKATAPKAAASASTR